ncbi:MAG: hypothetical protein ACFFAA_10085 [Promethearchaeota archaeon]
MVEFLKGKALIGPLIALIGAILWLMGNIYGLTRYIGFFPPIFIFWWIPSALGLILAIVALVGALLALMGNEKGSLIAIITGAIGVVGMWFFIGHIYYFDPILVLVGGILAKVIRFEKPTTGLDFSSTLIS